MESRLPLGAERARSFGLIDDHAGPDDAGFLEMVRREAEALAVEDVFESALQHKRACRADDERKRALADYRDQELAQMHLNFYGFDPSYHIARHRFVHRTPHAWTPLHLARHRSA